MVYDGGQERYPLLIVGGVSRTRDDRARLTRRDSVLGAKTSRARRDEDREGLGLRTVGDLLRHFPRRYVDTGELTERRRAPARASMLTVVGEIVSSASCTPTSDRRTGRPAYRLEVVVAHRRTARCG